MSRDITINFGLKGGQTVSVHNFDGGFQVERDDETEPDEAMITIFNLSEKVRGQLREAKTVTLINDGVGTFTGDVEKTDDNWEGTDIAFRTKAKDSMKQLTKHISLSFPANTSIQQALDAIVMEAGFTQSTILLPVTGVYKRGRVFDDSAQSILDDIAATFNARIVGQDGKFVMYQRNANSRVVVNLDRDKGLIGTPQRHGFNEELDTNNEQNGEVKRDAWIVQSLLVPQIRPGTILNVTSRTLTGQVVVRSVTHSGARDQLEYYSTSIAEVF